MTISNVGEYDGDEVVQLYVRDPESLRDRPEKSLRGFKRIHVARGETKLVRIPLAVRDLRVYDEVKDDYDIRPGKYELQIGASSADIRQTLSLQIMK